MQCLCIPFDFNRSFTQRPKTNFINSPKTAQRIKLDNFVCNMFDMASVLRSMMYSVNCSIRSGRWDIIFKIFRVEKKISQFPRQWTRTLIFMWSELLEDKWTFNFSQYFYTSSFHRNCLYSSFMEGICNPSDKTAGIFQLRKFQLCNNCYCSLCFWTCVTICHVTQCDYTQLVGWFPFKFQSIHGS